MQLFIMKTSPYSRHACAFGVYAMFMRTRLDVCITPKACHEFYLDSFEISFLKSAAQALL